MDATTAEISLATLPALGQPLERGMFAGLTLQAGAGAAAIVLLRDRPGKPLTWQEATAWAAARDGELPNRVVAATLFAGLPHEFKSAWYWTATEGANPDTAELQSSTAGIRSLFRKALPARACAVRLIPLQA